MTYYVPITDNQEMAYYESTEPQATKLKRIEETLTRIDTKLDYIIDRLSRLEDRGNPCTYTNAGSSNCNGNHY